MTAVATSLISDRLRTPLRRVAQRKWRVDAAVSGCKTVAFAMLCLLPAALILGRFENLWMPVRIVLASIAWLAVGAVVFVFSRPVFTRWTLRRAALLIERNKPEFDERLSSAVELAGMKEENLQGSPELLAHLFRQAELDADSVEPDRVVPVDRLIRWSMLLAPVLLVWLTLTLVPSTRHMTIRGTYRVLMPWRSEPVPPTQMDAAHPLPQVTAVEITCDYPPYTGMPAAVIDSDETTIKALVGTRVTVSLRSTVPLTADRSMLNFSNGRSVALQRSDDDALAYHGQFVVADRTTFQINLTSEAGLSSRDPQQREIVAAADQPPVIVIGSPEPRVTVNANDTVPVKFVATDDFGIAKIDAILQVDDGPAQTVPVTFKSDDKRTVKGQPYTIAVSDILKSQAGVRAGTITYQLRATDNREPDPQVGYSARQVLKIDYSDHANFQTEQDKTTARDLKDAIQRAINQLDREQQQMDQTRQVDPHQSLDQGHRRELDQAASAIAKTAQDLDHAAEQARQTTFDPIARQVQEIAEKPMQAAADDAAQANLNQDKGQDRQHAAERAMKEIAQAKEALRNLRDSNAVDKAQNHAQAVRDLNDAAQKQQQAADLMKSPEQMQQQPHDPQSQRQQQQAMRDQQQANEKLQEAMQHSETLRDPEAQAAAQQLNDVIRKVEEAQRRQQTASAQTEKQKSAQDIQQNANDLAKQQEALNQEIARSAEENHDALQRANANAPSTDQQHDIVKSLNRNQISDARTQMQHSAEQLRQAARQLQNAAGSDKAHRDDDQHAADQDSQLAQKQAAISQAAEQQQRALAKLQNTPQPDQTTQQQQNVVEQSREAKKAAEQLGQQAKDSATQARAKRAEADLSEAQEHAAHAADAQKQAAEHQQQANDASNADEARAAEQNAHDDLARAQEQQQAAQHAMAKAQENLRNASGDPQNTDAKLTDAQQAAQAAQEAAQAQKEASQQNPAAAKQAANALARAAQAMARSSAGSTPGSSQGQPQSAQEDEAKQPSVAQGPAKNPHEGISLLSGIPITLPASVLDMGITADEWAVLPPLMKKDLINAAQQNGPPAYRQMMRAYFAKVAKMQAGDDK